jgi:putative membrane protein (TIGR04086 family)
MNTIVWKSAFGGAITGWICAAVGVVVAVGGGSGFHWTSGSRTIIATIGSLLGCLLGGFRAGLLERAAPLSNGAGAGALTALPLALIGLAQNPTRAFGVVFALFLGASVGTFGGMVSNGSRRVKG